MGPPGSKPDPEQPAHICTNDDGVDDNRPALDAWQVHNTPDRGKLGIVKCYCGTDEWTGRVPER